MIDRTADPGSAGSRSRAFARLCAVVPAFLCALLLSGCFESGYPELEFVYSPVFDSVCTRRFQEQLEPLWVEDAIRAQDRFQKRWRDEDGDVLGTLVKHTGRKFKEREMPVSLFVCRKMSSMHRPLMVKLRWFIEGPAMSEPMPEETFMGFVLHQVLHLFLEQHFTPREPTPLLKKYADEPRRVREHLHLLALQKMIYRELGWENRLAKTIQFDGLISKSYKRAWEILGQDEGYMPFVKEFAEWRRPPDTGTPDEEESLILRVPAVESETED